MTGKCHYCTHGLTPNEVRALYRGEVSPRNIRLCRECKEELKEDGSQKD